MAPAPAERASFVAKLGSVALTLAAIGGVACIALVILSAFFNVTLIMFKTGSMSPAIPAGSLAVVREIAASEISVGDVVTVDRPGALPVTHRVMTVAGTAGEERTITLRGDANLVDDPAPYTVSTVRLVLLSVPELANAVITMSNPLFLGGVAVAASSLVTWAFWPRRPRRVGAHKRGLPTASAAVAVAIAVCTTASLMAPAQPASAAEQETLITGDVLRLMTVADSVELSHLVPGERVPWQVGVWTREGATGDIVVSMSASGALAQDPNGLQVEVWLCDVRWVDGSCASGARWLGGPGPASTILSVPLAVSTIDATSQLWINVDAWLPANRATPPSSTATLSLSAVGSGDSVETGSGALSNTGRDSSLPLALAVGAISAGLLVAFLARLRRSRERLP